MKGQFLRNSFRKKNSTDLSFKKVFLTEKRCFLIFLNALYDLPSNSVLPHHSRRQNSMLFLHPRKKAPQNKNTFIQISPRFTGNYIFLGTLRDLNRRQRQHPERRKSRCKNRSIDERTLVLLPLSISMGHRFEVHSRRLHRNVCWIDSFYF